jgi:hypothetical protein
MISRATRWRQLNYLRVGIFMAINLAHFPLVFRVARLLAGR